MQKQDAPLAEGPDDSDQRARWSAIWKNSMAASNAGVIKKLMKSLYRTVVPQATFNHYLFRWLKGWVRLAECNVLEIGGGGGLGQVLGSRVRSYALLDYAESAIELAREVLRDTPNARCMLGDMFEYAPAERYDLVISVGLIEHFFGADKERCMRAHKNLSRRYVCIAAPADSPRNWWRHFRFQTTKEYPNQRPVSERELFDLCLTLKMSPVAMTRLDPWYALRQGFFARSWRQCYAAWFPAGHAVECPTGGILAMLAEV